MSETQNNIGVIHTEDLPRDAVHIAVVQTTAYRNMTPGEHIGLNSDDNPIGVVDPFINFVKTGDKFYLFLYPNTVTGLTHHYYHPALDI